MLSQRKKKLPMNGCTKNEANYYPLHTDDSELLELCPTISRTSVEGALRQLIKEGAIIRHGSGRATFYTRND